MLFFPKDEDGNVILFKNINPHQPNTSTRETSKYKEFWDKEIKGCKICKATMRRDNFVRHYTVVHLKSEVYICDSCGDKFTSKKNLDVHKLYKHTNPAQQTKFECKLCEKCFLLKG